MMMPFVTPFACALVLPAGVAIWGARRRWRLGVGLARVALAAYLTLLLALTLTSSPFHAETSAGVERAAGAAAAPVAAAAPAPTARLNLVPLRSVARYIAAPWPVMRVELLGNIAAFVPFGVLVPLAWGRRLRGWHVLAMGVALSIGIEAVQFAFVPARVADIDDVLLNALGVAVGLAFLGAVSRLSARPVAALRADASGGPGHQPSDAASRSNTCL